MWLGSGVDGAGAERRSAEAFRIGHAVGGGAVEMARCSPTRGWSPGRQRGRGDDLAADQTPHGRFKHSLHVFCMCVIMLLPSAPVGRQLR